VEAAIVAIYAVCLLAGGVTRVWWALLLPPTALPILYIGLGQGWWGSGLGETWQLAAALVVAVGLAAAGLGVVLGRAFSRRGTG
jgi:hypothetical protein